MSESRGEVGMQTLSRAVRFTVNPFLEADAVGANSYASKPAGEGLGQFFELWVSLEGAVDAATGFVVNVHDIDVQVRKCAVPVFARRLRERYRAGRHIGAAEMAGLLGEAKRELDGQFGSAKVGELRLKVNPFRTIAVRDGNGEMVYLSEKFEFAATHKLWNEELSEQENLRVFGKCAHRSGHGHNYIVEVTVKAEAQTAPPVSDIERVVDAELMEVVDHKNLNVDVPAFGERIPTVENIAVFAWERLAGKFAGAELHCVTVWETDRTYCSYYG